MVHADNQSLWLSAFALANKAQTNMTIEKVKSAEKNPTDLGNKIN